MIRFLSLGLAACLASGLFAPAADAAVNVNRRGDENPMQEIARSVFYGGLTGLMVGGVLAIASEDGDDGALIRWGLVGGTLAGLAIGLHHVNARPSAALIEFDDRGAHFGAIAPRAGPGGSLSLALVRAGF